MVYEMLSQYYIQQRSVVFIIDSDFDSKRFQDKANKLVYDEFLKLDHQDYFGYIKLSKNFRKD